MPDTSCPGAPTWLLGGVAAGICWGIALRDRHEASQAQGRCLGAGAIALLRYIESARQMRHHPRVCARQFTKDCHKAGVVIHGTFILGLPVETKETIEQTIRFAQELDVFSLQVSLAAPYPGTYLHRQALENGWLDEKHAELVDAHGVQIAPLHYPHLSHTEIFDSVETFYRRFYFRSGKIASIVGEMVRSPEMMKRRLREGIEFFHFLRERREAAH